MKILFIGDYSNFHVTLAKELQTRGHQVTIVSEGSRCMDTARDIDITRMPGTIGSIKYLYRLFSIMQDLSGYDIVQLINPGFFQLKPGKLRYFFKELRNHNGSIFLSLAGTDSNFVNACTRSSIFRYSEYRSGGMPTGYALKNKYAERAWLHPTLHEYCKYIYDHVDGCVSALYEYDAAARPLLGDKLSYIGLPIDLAAHKYQALDPTGKINLFIGIKEEMAGIKGSDLMLEAASSLKKELPDKINVIQVQNLPYTEYMKKQAEGHIVLDQLYSYTPAMNALGAMACGKATLSGGEEEFYDFIGEKELRPVINVNPTCENIADKLRSVIVNPEELYKRSVDGRRFVEKHNDAKIVTDRLTEHWLKTLESK